MIGDVDSKKQKNEDAANAFPFKSLCAIFEEIEKASGAEKKLKFIFNKSMKLMLKGQSFFPIMRLLLPLNDSERGSYGIKQTTVARLYVDVLHLNKQSTDAQRLIHWKDPSKMHSSSNANRSVSGDFCSILESVLTSRVRSEYSNATVGDVNNLLDELSLSTGAQKTDFIKNKIKNQFNANEQKWLMRLVFQDLKIGLRHEQVLKYFYPDALQRYNETTNLRKICEEEHKKGCGIQLFSIYKPMLAKGFPRSSSGQVFVVENVMQNKEFYTDIKLDGERIACHISLPYNADYRASAVNTKDFEVMFATRNGSDYTTVYKPLSEFVCHYIKPGITAIILDGEVCGWDEQLQSNVAFGSNQTLARNEKEEWNACEDELRTQSGKNINILDAYLNLDQWLNYTVFDILYIEGPFGQQLIHKYRSYAMEGEPGAAAGDRSNISWESIAAGEIIQMPLYVRRQILRDSFIPTVNRFQYITGKLVKLTYRPGTSSSNGSADTEQSIVEQRRKLLEEFYNLAIEGGEEGLVVKDARSMYELGSRKDSWVKMKPEYGDQTTDLDLIVLGAYYGEGRGFRGEGVSVFLCGVLSNGETDMKEGKYQTLVKVGGGFNYDELAKMRDLIGTACAGSQKAMLSSKSNSKIQNSYVPSYVAEWHPKRDDIPNIWIPPEKSFVIQIKCAEITPSTSFSCGYTCRFPRFVCIRSDKSIGDVMSVKDVKSIYDSPRQLSHSTGTGNSNANRDGGIVYINDKVLLPSYSGTQSSYGCGDGDVMQLMANNTNAMSDIISERIDMLKRKKKSNKSRTNTKAKSTINQVSDVFQVSQEYVEPVGNIFEGKLFCVLESADFHYSFDAHAKNIAYSRDQLVQMIREQDGSVSAVPFIGPSDSAEDKCIVVTGNALSLQASNLIASRSYDVIHFSYIIACVEAGCLIPLKSLYYLSMCKATRTVYLGTCDKYGDPFTEELNPRELMVLLHTSAYLNKIVAGSSCDTLLDRDVAFLDNWRVANDKCIARHNRNISKLNKQMESLRKERQKLIKQYHLNENVESKSIKLEADDHSYSRRDPAKRRKLENELESLVSNAINAVDEAEQVNGGNDTVKLLAIDDQIEYTRSQIMSQEEVVPLPNSQKAGTPHEPFASNAEPSLSYYKQLNNMLLEESRSIRSDKGYVEKILHKDWKSVLNNHSEYVSDTSDYETIMRMLDATKVNPLYSSTTVVYVDIFDDFGDSLDDSELNPSNIPEIPYEQPGTSFHSILNPMKVKEYSPTEIQRRSVHLERYSSLFYLIIRLRLYGATVALNLHVGVTHVVTLSNSDSGASSNTDEAGNAINSEGDTCDLNLERYSVIKKYCRTLRLLPGNTFEKRIVSSQWVNDILEN